jgi:hypothetical protein
MRGGEVPGRRHHPDVPLINPDYGRTLPDVAEPAEITAESRSLDARARAAAESLVHYGHDETIDITGQIANPLGVQNLIPFTVPTGLVAGISRIAVVYSNALVGMSMSIGWRLVVNGGRVENVQNMAYFPLGADYSYNSFSDLSTPREISTVWVQSGETIAIEVTDRVGAFNLHLVIAGRLAGRLYKPASPRLLMREG